MRNYALGTAFPIVFSVVLALFTGCASTDKSKSTGEIIDDSVITARIKSAMINDPTLKASEINVETYKGNVQLSGFVNSKEDIRHAVDVANDVKGVKSVSNNMKLK